MTPTTTGTCHFHHYVNNSEQHNDPGLQPEFPNGWGFHSGGLRCVPKSCAFKNCSPDTSRDQPNQWSTDWEQGLGLLLKNANLWLCPKEPCAWDSWSGWAFDQSSGLLADHRGPQVRSRRAKKQLLHFHLRVGNEICNPTQIEDHVSFSWASQGYLYV